MPGSKQFNRLKECRHGRMLYNINDAFVGRSLNAYGEYGEGEIELFTQLVRPGDVVVEAGANIGAHTLWFAKATAPDGFVVAFEPQRLAFQTMCANLALNDITNALAYQQACGRERGQLMVPILDPTVQQNFGGLALGAEKDGDEVPVVPIDEMKVPRCRLLKADVEGMELEVLQGAQRLIERCKPALYVENNDTEGTTAKSKELIKFIASLGYELYWHTPPLFNPDNFLGNRKDVFPKIISLNMLCMPAGTDVKDLERIEVPA